MNNQEATIFDYLKASMQKEPEGEEGFFKVAQNMPELKDDSYLSKAADYGKSALKGTIEGLSRFGRMFGPLPVLEFDEAGMPHIPSEEEVQSRLTQGLEEALPQGKENLVQKGLRRGLGMAPSMAAFPGAGLGAIPRSIAAGYAGEGAKELGAPEWAQAAAELTAYMGPNLTQKLLETGKNKEIVQAGRKFGLSDEQIAPLLKQDFKQEWLSKIVPKRERTEKILGSTKEALGEAYGTLQKSPTAGIQLAPEQQKNLLNKLSETALSMPNVVREKVNKDFIDLLRKPITGESLMNLHKDINKSLGGKTKELSLFKQPIYEAMKEVSPELAEDFGKINELYTRFHKISSKLKPTFVSDIISGAEYLGGALASYLMGDLKGIKAMLIEKGGKIGARELLLNPRLQQLGEKFLIALNQNKFGLANKIAYNLEKQMSDLDPKLEFSVPSEDELKKIFGNKG